MIAALARLTWASSWGGAASDRRRATLLAAAAAVVAVVGCAAVSALLLSARTSDRSTGRAFAPATGPEDVALERTSLFDETPDGAQVYVYWWRIVDPSIVIPGVPAEPTTDRWYVTPALAELARGDRTLAARYGDAEVIGSEGVAHPGELMAYRFVGAGPELSESLAARPGTDWIGDGSQTLDLLPVLVVALGLVGLPGLGLVAAALSPVASAVDRRLALLRALGAAGPARVATAALHGVLTAGPGALAGALGWWALAPRLEAVPLVGRAVFRRDLALPAAAAVAVAVVVAGLVAVASVAHHRRSDEGARPREPVVTAPSPTRLVPLVAGASTLVIGVVANGSVGARLFLVGVLATTFGAVVALPTLMERAGASLARRGTLTGLLVGRRLQATATSTTRALVAVGALAALVPVVAAWVAVARTIDEPPATDEYPVELRGDPPDAALAALVRDTGARVLRVVARPDGRLGLVGDCAALAGDVELERCEAGGFVLRPQPLLGHLAGLPGRAEGRPGDQRVATLLFSAEGPTVEARLRDLVVNGDDPGLHVLAPGRGRFHESPLVGWILGAATVAGVMAGLALTLSLVGQSARIARTRGRLVSLGADDGLVRRLTAAESGLAVALVGLSCAGVGGLMSWSFVQRDPAAAVPVAALGLLVVAVLALALVAATVAGLAAVPPRRRWADRT